MSTTKTPARVATDIELVTYKQIFELLKKAVKQAYDVELGAKDEELLLNKFEAPKDALDFEHNVALPTFLIAKPLTKLKPQAQNFNEFCFAIAAKLSPIMQTLAEQESHPVVLKVQNEGPYMNFFYRSAYLAKILNEILHGNMLKKRPAKNENVMIEYSQPNTHKVFHVGHMRNAALGNSLVQLFEFSGYNVVAANYIGDEGTHIAKCLWYYLNFYPNRTGDVEKDAPANVPKVEWLGDMYAKACDELDFTRWCKFPYPGFITAKITKIDAHPVNPAWKVVTVNDGKSDFVVVCGGKGYNVNDIIAYAPVGSKNGSRLIQPADFKGVTSYGMILSEKELELSDLRDKIFVFPSDAPIGVEITELTRYEHADLPKTIKIADEIIKRNAQVKEVLKKMEEKDPEMIKLWQITREWCLKDFRTIYDWVGCRFDHYFHESDVGEESKELVLEAYKEGKLTKSDNAIGADLTKHKLGFVVLLTSAGTGLYATKDLSLAKRKFQEFKIDRSIYVVDVAQSLHFQQVFKTLEILGFKQASKCYHLAYGLVVLPDGKMSSRKNNIIMFSQLRTLLMSKIDTEYMTKHKDKPEWTAEQIQEATRRIAIATIKYGMLNQDNNKDIVFSLEEWTARTGNTGPYLMYAYTRTRAILRKTPLSDEEKNKADFSLLTDETERKVLQLLNNFSDTVERATETYRPQLVCIYLYHLAKQFSKMYEKVPVKQVENVALKAARLALVEATGLTLKKGLELLGIETLERM